MRKTDWMEKMENEERDAFVFATDKREVPRVRDYIAGDEEVEGVCEGKCRDILGMEMWKSRYGGDLVGWIVFM